MPNNLMDQYGPPQQQEQMADWGKMSDDDYEKQLMKRLYSGNFDMDAMEPAERDRLLQYMTAEQSKGDQFAALGQSQRQAQSSQVPSAPLTSIQGLMSMVGQPQTAKKVAPRMGLMGAGRFK